MPLRHCLSAALGKAYDVIVGFQPDLISAGAHGVDVVAISGNNLDGPNTIPGPTS